MKCTECKYCVLSDYGYSNWTVEGTTVSCLLDVHPNNDFDRYYGEEPKLNYAEQCSRFTEGDAVIIDVDREDVSYNYRTKTYNKTLGEAYSSNPEISKLIDEQFSM